MASTTDSRGPSGWMVEGLPLFSVDRDVLKRGMPIYEYACEGCGQTIEVIQKMSDPMLTTHQECGGTLTKLLSTPSFQIRGSVAQGLEAEINKAPAVARQTENDILRREKKKKPAQIISTPAGKSGK